jgi:tellurite resistance protein
MTVAKNLPIGMYGAVMGLVGLGLAARAAAPLFPGVFRAPAYFTELWVALGLMAFLVLFPLYLVKILRYPDAARADFTNPVSMGFCAAFPVGMLILSAGLAPYARDIANAMWWIAAILLVTYQLWGLWRIFTTRIALAQVNAGWLILFVGGIVAPNGGVALGNTAMSSVLFTVSAIASVPLLAVLVLRLARGPSLPEPLRPTWFILLVPPSLVSVHGSSLLGITVLEELFLAALPVLAVLLYYARNLPRWPFSAAWWAMTFPLDAFAFAAVRYAQTHEAPAWRVLAGVGMVLATGAVALVLLRSAAQALRRR